MELNELTIQEAGRGLRGREFSPIELVDACFKSIKKKEKKIGAFLYLFEKEARQAAKESEKKIRNSDNPALLEGIPVVIKDNILYADHICTAGSKILADYNAVYDATVVEKIKESGAIIIGKANLDEFAMGSSTENSAFKKTKNPWDVKRVPGGSSGGSAAAVAADMCLAALGSDTGGSVRQPASFCGCVGVKPTYGRVSRHGLIAMASSFDQIGPIAKSVQDAAWLLQAVEGIDQRDSTSVKAEPVGIEFPDANLKGLKIGIPKEFFNSGLDGEVKQSVEEAIAKLEEIGAKIEEIELPHSSYGLAVYYVLMPSEVSSNLARFDGVRYGMRQAGKDLLEVYKNSRAKGFGGEVKRRVMLGTFALSSGYHDAYYARAQRVRTIIRNEFKEAFKKVDIIAGPTAPVPAFKLGEKFEDPLTMYLTDIYTVTANVAGIPAMSLPCGMTKSGLPIGLQLMASYFKEDAMFRVGNAYEQAAGWRKEKPQI